LQCRTDILRVLLDAGGTIDDPGSLVVAVLGGQSVRSIATPPMVQATIALCLELGADADTKGPFVAPPSIRFETFADAYVGEHGGSVTDENVRRAWTRLVSRERFETSTLSLLEDAVLLWELDAEDRSTARDPSPIVRLLVEHGAEVTPLARFRAQRRMDHWRDEVLEALGD
ncbi:MAG: hypothetical protein KDA28_11865, partial [Phycisphaerales bacterium]|nr:hypothetical protein [Phycisphaerales bacterium]